jgi:hypothetical protein
MDLVEKCNVSIGQRVSFYKVMNALCESGKGDGTQSLINLLYNHLDRWSSYLFSPTELRFSIGYTSERPKVDLERAAIVSRLLTDTWQYDNTDLIFSAGVQEAGKFGCSILKQWVQPWEEGGSPNYCSGLVMPWNFGVYAENENDLAQQPAMCETTVLTMPQAWQRIAQLDISLADRERLFKRVAASAKAGQASDVNQNFFRQVFSTAPLNTNGVAGSPGKATPGGVVWFGNQAMGTLAPQLGVEIALMHEIWVQGVDDYETIQLIEPDILLTPRPGRKSENLLISGDNKSGLHPYTLIQPNITPGYFWGRSEITDLIAPQAMLSDLAADIMRLYGLQVDKLLGFAGYDGLADERYDASRQAGYFNMPPNATVTDLTPRFPEVSLPLLTKLVEIFNMIGGTPDIMQGKGDSGVRAGVHADTLLKTASPRMRQSSLIAERQCAAAAELTLALMQAKDPRKYHTKADKMEDVEKTEFLLTDLPEDRRVSVDSHSSSPIFADDHQQMVAFGLKSGFITKHAAIDLLPLPNKELLHAELREQEQKSAEQMQKLQQTNPELAEKIALRKVGHR